MAFDIEYVSKIRDYARTEEIKEDEYDDAGPIVEMVTIPVIKKKL